MRVGRAVAGHEVGSHHCVAASAKAAGYNDCDLGDLQRGGERCSPCHQLSAASYAPSTCRQATAAVMQAPPTHLHAGHSSRHAGPTHPPARRPQQPSCRPHPPTCTQATAAVMQAPPTHLHAGHSSRHAGPTHPPARRPQQPSCRPHPPTCTQATAAVMQAPPTHLQAGHSSHHARLGFGGSWCAGPARVVEEDEGNSPLPTQFCEVCSLQVSNKLYMPTL